MGKLIDVNMVNDFKSSYVSVVELARNCKSSSRFLNRLLAGMGVKIAFVRKDHRYLRHLYKRSDLLKLDLSEAVAAAKRARKPQKKRWISTLIDAKSAAAILGIDLAEFNELVQCGDINPRLSKTSKNSKGAPLLFSRFFVERYKQWHMDTRNLVSVSQAAELLGEDRSIFEKRWVRTGRLTRVEVEDKLGKHFYRRSEVEEMVELKKSFVTVPEAAKILGINRGALYWLINTGKLNAVSGPDVEGFGCPRYLRDDVEKLALERKNRFQPPAEKIEQIPKVTLQRALKTAISP